MVRINFFYSLDLTISRCGKSSGLTSDSNLLHAFFENDKEKTVPNYYHQQQYDSVMTCNVENSFQFNHYTPDQSRSSSSNYNTEDYYILELESNHKQYNPSSSIQPPLSSVHSNPCRKSIEIQDVPTQPLENLSTNHFSTNFSKVIIPDEVSRADFDPKLNNFLYQLLLSCHEGLVLLGSYEHDKISTEKKETSKDTTVDEAIPAQDNSLEESFNNDLDFLNNYSFKREKRFDRKKLCNL